MRREYFLEFTDRAEVAYGRLPKAIQQRIDQVLRAFQQVGPRRPYVVKLRGHRSLYLARATSDIRIIFQMEEDTIRILDIATHDKINRLSDLYD